MRGNDEWPQKILSAMVHNYSPFVGSRGSWFNSIHEIYSTSLHHRNPDFYQCFDCVGPGRHIDGRRYGRGAEPRPQQTQNSC